MIENIALLDRFLTLGTGFVFAGFVLIMTLWFVPLFAKNAAIKMVIEPASWFLYSIGFIILAVCYYVKGEWWWGLLETGFALVFCAATFVNGRSLIRTAKAYEKNKSRPRGILSRTDIERLSRGFRREDTTD